MKKYDAVSFGMLGAEYRASYIDCVCPMAWSRARRRSTLPFGPAARGGRPDHTRTTSGPHADHKGITSVPQANPRDIPRNRPVPQAKRPTRTTRGPQGDHKGTTREYPEKSIHKKNVSILFSGREAQSTRRYIPKKISICIYAKHCVSIIHLCKKTKKYS